MAVACRRASAPYFAPEPSATTSPVIEKDTSDSAISVSSSVNPRVLLAMTNSPRNDLPALKLRGRSCKKQDVRPFTTPGDNNIGAARHAHNTPVHVATYFCIDTVCGGADVRAPPPLLHILTLPCAKRPPPVGPETASNARSRSGYFALPASEAESTAGFSAVFSGSRTRGHSFPRFW